MLQLLVQYPISGHELIENQDSNHHVDLSAGRREQSIKVISETTVKHTVSFPSPTSSVGSPWSMPSSRAFSCFSICCRAELWPLASVVCSSLWHFSQWMRHRPAHSSRQHNSLKKGPAWQVTLVFSKAPSPIISSPYSNSKRRETYSSRVDKPFLNASGRDKEPVKYL